MHIGLTEIQHITTALASGNSPEYLCLKLPPLESNSFSALLTSLKSGRCPTGLRLSLQGQIDIKALCLVLSSGQCPEGLSLDMQRTVFGDEGAIAIAEALESGQCPENLDISLGNGIGPIGATRIAQALASGKCPRGLALHFNFNKIDKEWLEPLAVVLKSGQCPENLEVDWTWNYSSIADMLFENEMLFDVLNSGKAPRGFKCTFGHLNAPGIKKLTEILCSGRCPENLKLYLNAYGTRLSHLIKHIAHALKSGHSPEGLGLQFTGGDLDRQEAEILADALNPHNCPPRISLSLNQLHFNDHLKPFLQALIYNTTLSSLRITRLNKEMAVLLLQALQVNHTLTSVEITEFGDVSPDMEKAIRQAIDNAMSRNQHALLAREIDHVIPTKALSNIVLAYLDFSPLDVNLQEEARKALEKGELTRFYQLAVRESTLHSVSDLQQALVRQEIARVIPTEVLHPIILAYLNFSPLSHHTQERTRKALEKGELSRFYQLAMREAKSGSVSELNPSAQTALTGYWERAFKKKIPPSSIQHFLSNNVDQFIVAIQLNSKTILYYQISGSPENIIVKELSAIEISKLFVHYPQMKLSDAKFCVAPAEMKSNEEGEEENAEHAEHKERKTEAFDYLPLSMGVPQQAPESDTKTTISLLSNSLQSVLAPLPQQSHIHKLLQPLSDYATSLWSFNKPYQKQAKALLTRLQQELFQFGDSPPDILTTALETITQRIGQIQSEVSQTDKPYASILKETLKNIQTHYQPKLAASQMMPVKSSLAGMSPSMP